MTCVCVCDWLRVAEYLDVDEKATGDSSDIPPVLMTRDVLAKFRTMEAEAESAKLQAPPQQRHVCDSV